MTLTFLGHLTSSVTHVSIRFAIGHFPLVVFCNQASNLQHFSRYRGISYLLLQTVIRQEGKRMQHSSVA